jgi:hypothetical protein
VIAAVLFALAATAVAGLFSARLAQQYAARRRGHALAWAISLGLFAVASFMVALGIGAGWSPAVFAVYWFAGALVTVPYLAAGQLMLLDPKRTVLYATLVGLATAWALAAVAISPIEAEPLRHASAEATIPVGDEVYGGTLAHRLLGWFNYTALIVVVGVVWSAVRTRRWLILLIAVGVVIAGTSFAFVRAGMPALFSAFLAVGVATMYAGFRAAAKPPKRPAGNEPDRAGA